MGFVLMETLMPPSENINAERLKRNFIDTKRDISATPLSLLSITITKTSTSYAEIPARVLIILKCRLYSSCVYIINAYRRYVRRSVLYERWKVKNRRRISNIYAAFARIFTPLTITDVILKNMFAYVRVNERRKKKNENF